MKILVWQWGRFGGAPQNCVDWAAGFNTVPGFSSVFSLSRQAELLHGPNPPVPDLLVDTYTSAGGYVARVLNAPWLVPRLTAQVRALAPDIALCAMPGPLDLAMHAALRRLDIPMAVVVHDADPHPGDGYPLQMDLQRALVRRAKAIVALSGHVARRLEAQHLLAGKVLIRSVLPAPRLPEMPPPRAHGGPFRLLSFGRLLAYKGLDLLAESLARLLPDPALVVRVVGSGPEGPELAALRRLPGVTVENRWVPEAEVPALLAWADGVALSHREASQSGVAVAALTARRLLVATRVGGLVEQAEGDPAAILCDVSVDGLTTALRQMFAMHAPGPRTPSAQPPIAAFAEALARAVERQPRSAKDPGGTPVGGPGGETPWPSLKRQ
jgi:glycosyltransferase involved in cell wall biosynthesis